MNGKMMMVIGLVVVAVLVVGGILIGPKVLSKLGMGTATPTPEVVTQNPTVIPSPSAMASPEVNSPSVMSSNSSNTATNNSDAQLDKDLSGLDAKMGAVAQDQANIDAGLNQTAPNVQ